MSDLLPLFVYGTLLAGEAQAGLLGRLNRRPAMVRGHLYRMAAGYPALVLAADGWVHGELVDPPNPRVLELIDTYEGVDEGLYQRVTANIRVGLRAEPGWVYAMDITRARKGARLPQGKWRSTRRR